MPNQKLNIMKIDLEKIKSFGTLEYPIEKMINVLELGSIESKEFIKEFNKTDSDIKVNYNRGRDISDYILDSKLFEMARSGDIKAIDKLEDRKWKRQQKR